MSYSGLLIERHILKAITPYLCLSWLVLTGVLLTQQAGRFAELLGAANAPLQIFFDLAAGVIPNISVFTIPMSMLIGTAAAFGRMGGDSELIAMRAAGVGTRRIVSPVLLLGTLLSALTLFNGFELAPAAAGSMREAMLRAAILKLDTPVQPRSFNTQLPDKVIYVRDGDEARGQWGRVFIYWLEAGRELRLVTARSGRIDNTGEQSELVLSDAVVTTLPRTVQSSDLSRVQVVSERSAQLRVRLDTGKNNYIKQLSERIEGFDELDLSSLLARARTPTESRAALSALHKRAALCTTPIAFALLGIGLGGRARRGGRGLAVLLSLLSMLLFYFVFLAGDYLVKIDFASPPVGAWLATGLAFIVGGAMLAIGDRKFPGFVGRWFNSGGQEREVLRRAAAPRRLRNLFLFALLDRSIFFSLTIYFITALLVLVGVFLIFTVFELLRFLALSGVGAWTVILYLWYLMPLASLSVTPICILIATLIAYSLMSKRSETTAWWACGQSLYRLALPGMVFSVLVSWGYRTVQEQVLPQANQRQDALRLQIRGRPGRIATSSAGLQWVSTYGESVYAFRSGTSPNELLQISGFFFDQEGVHLRRLITGDKATVVGGEGLAIESAKILELTRGTFFVTPLIKIDEKQPAEVFKQTLIPASALNSRQLSDYINSLKARDSEKAEVARYSVSSQRRISDPLSPLVMSLISVPLATLFGRRSAVKPLFAAVILGIVFWGGSSLFQQLGNYGLIPPALAAFALPVLFASFGIYVFTKTGT